MSTALDDVYERIDARLPEALDELTDFVRIPGVSAQPSADLIRSSEFVHHLMLSSGLETRVLEGHGPPAVYGERIVDTALPTVLIYGHHDVQPADGDDWDSPPFEPTVRAGRIFGRGTSDNKGQHLAQLGGIRATLAARGELPVNVKVLIEGEEEIGSPHLPDLVREHRELLRADLAITSDGPVHRSGHAQLVMGTRGQLGVEVHTRGASTDAHSGSLGGLLPDAAWGLVQLLATLRHRDGRIAVRGFTDAVLPPTHAEAEAIAQLPPVLDAHLVAYDIDQLPPPHGPGYYERLMLHPTMTVNALASGYSGPGMKTVISNRAMARIDMRLVPGQDPEAMFEVLHDHVRHHDPRAVLTRVSAVPPSRTPIDNPVVSVIAGAVAQATAQVPYIVPSLGSTLPNYVFTDILGIPSVLVPYANPDQNNHAANENFELARFSGGMRICATMLDHIGRSGQD